MPKTKKQLLYAALLVVIWGGGGLWLVYAILIHPRLDRGPGWNVVILTLDTTRADHLNCYGYEWVETPALNMLAERGALFERAYSQIPLTLPAHTSLFSGTIPLYHGIQDNGGYRVPDELITLAEVLQGRGWLTAAFISAAVLDRIFNLDQGFAHWDQEDIKPQIEGTPLVAERKGGPTTDAALAWLQDHHQERFFLWIHYYDPHAAYDPPEPYRSLYYSRTNPNGLYDGEIAYMDSQIMRVLQELDERGLADNTLIIAVGDHGESLGEHGELTHAHFIYEGTQRVPLLIYVPGLKETGRRIENVVSLIDIMPTVLDYLGLPIPDQVEGKSLRGMIEGWPGAEDLERYAYLETHYCFFHYNWAPLSGIVGPRYKYIKAPKPELYDLINDPGEVNNLFKSEPRISASLRARLDEIEKKWADGFLQSEEADLSDRQREQLAALGYMTGGFEADASLAYDKDPKDFVDLISQLSRIKSYRTANDYEGMIDLADTILDLDPENPQAMSARADGLAGMGRNQEAIAAYQQYMEIHRETSDYHAQIAVGYLRIGIQYWDRKEYETAKSYYRQAAESCEKAIAITPNLPLPHYYLGRIKIALGDYEQAVERFTNPHLKDTDYRHIGLALIHEFQGNPDRAEKEFEKAEKLAGERSVIYWQELALFLIRKGRHADAVENLLKAIEADPSLRNEPVIITALKRAGEIAGDQTGRVHKEWALHLAGQNKLEEALAFLEQAIADHPSFKDNEEIKKTIEQIEGIIEYKELVH